VDLDATLDVYVVVKGSVKVNVNVNGDDAGLEKQPLAAVVGQVLEDDFVEALVVGYARAKSGGPPGSSDARGLRRRPKRGRRGGPQS
jgi:hypothetical protein